jgi:hypothetical protein
MACPFHPPALNTTIIIGNDDNCEALHAIFFILLCRQLALKGYNWMMHIVVSIRKQHEQVDKIRYIPSRLKDKILQNPWSCIERHD